MHHSSWLSMHAVYATHGCLLSNISISLVIHSWLSMHAVICCPATHMHMLSNISHSAVNANYNNYTVSWLNYAHIIPSPTKHHIGCIHHCLANIMI